MPNTPEIFNLLDGTPAFFQDIYKYYGISSISDAPKQSIEITKIKFYNRDNNTNNDYLEIGFLQDRFIGWNIHRLWYFIQLFTFELDRNSYNRLLSTYFTAWHFNPAKLHAIYYRKNGKRFIVFYFELFEGSGGGGNSIGVKIPAGS